MTLHKEDDNDLKVAALVRQIAGVLASEKAPMGAPPSKANVAYHSVATHRTKSELAPVLLSVTHAAEVLDVSRPTMYRLLKDKRNGIKVLFIGDMRRIEYASLLAWAARKAL